MRLALAVVLACGSADEASRRPARPMRQRDVDRWRARQSQHTYKPSSHHNFTSQPTQCMRTYGMMYQHQHG